MKRGSRAASTGRPPFVGFVVLLALLPLVLLGCGSDSGTTTVTKAPSRASTPASGGTGPAPGGGATSTRSTTTRLTVPANKHVTIKDSAFIPRSITVSVGATVTWTNEDSITHTVIAYNNSFSSQKLAPGDTFSHTFDWPGVSAYYCSIHPAMKGSVRVQ